MKKCQSLVDNKIYAVKIMRTTESEIIEQAKNEFANLNALNHELIIKVYEMFINKSKGRVNIVMEFMDGFENLHQSVADKGPIPENAAKNIFRMLLEAINEMHIHGICHR